jgi:hypothetical protein
MRAAGLILMAVGVALAAWGFAPTRRVPRQHRARVRRARARLIWDVCVDLPARLFYMSLFVLAPRNVSPGARIPRQQARRMVAAISPRTARRSVGKNR